LQWKKKKKTKKSLMGLHGSQKQNKRKIKKGNKTKERGWRALAATEEDKKKNEEKLLSRFTEPKQEKAGGVSFRPSATRWRAVARAERLDGNVDSQIRLTTASCYIVQATTIPA